MFVGLGRVLVVWGRRVLGTGVGGRGLRIEGEEGGGFREDVVGKNRYLGGGLGLGCFDGFFLETGWVRLCIFIIR